MESLITRVEWLLAADECARAVQDRLAVVELDALNGVDVIADHDVCAGVDEVVAERALVLRSSSLPP